VKIIQPSFSLHTSSGPLTREKGIELLRWVEYNARISHRSEEKQTEDSWKRFIQAIVMEHGDWSVTEHASVTAILRVDRGVTHELVRHRHFSYTQESTRFVNYGKSIDVEFIEPCWADESYRGNYIGYSVWIQQLKESERAYLDILNTKVSPQIARSVLPNALAATISITGNLRNWRHFFLMRTSKETHPDFKRITILMLAEFQRAIPILYDDIVPYMRQIDNLRKPR
jgi:thymidylate synthase (FAD)